MVCKKEDEALSHTTGAAQDGAILLGRCHGEGIVLGARRGLRKSVLTLAQMKVRKRRM